MIFEIVSFVVRVNFMRVVVRRLKLLYIVEVLLILEVSYSRVMNVEVKVMYIEYVYKNVCIRRS